MTQKDPSQVNLMTRNVLKVMEGDEKIQVKLGYKKAAEVLLKRIKKERLSSDEQLIIFPTELIVRKSSKTLN